MSQEEANARPRTRLGRLREERKARAKVIRERALVAEAKELWQQGDSAAALGAMRRALLIRGGTPALWHFHGIRLIEAGHPNAAHEAFLMALALDPGHVPALEMHIEHLYRRQASGEARDAVREFAALLPLRPELHRDALDFLIPYRVHEGRDSVRQGPDRVARAVLALEDGEEAAAAGSGLTASEIREARVRHALARGRISAAVSVLKDMPAESIPLDALRRAIRRTMKKKNPTGASHLISQYLRCRPKDSWARERLIEIEEYRRSTVEASEMCTLEREGFPFREPSGGGRSPVVGEDARTVFYLLHNSLPYNSGGYATRSHGLLSALNRNGWDVRGVTRPGFPFDLSNSTHRDEVPAEETIDGVRYHRLSTLPELPAKRPLVPYIKEYAARLARLAETETPVIVHGASNHWNGLAAVELGRALGVPSIYEVRGLWEVTRLSREPGYAESDHYRFAARMESDAAAGATKVIAITAALRDELVRRGVAEDKIVVVPNGVDTDRFTPIDPDPEIIRRHDLHGKTVIGYVGSIVDYEGLEYLLEAAARMRAKRDDFRVLIVGDGAALDGLRIAAAEHGVEDTVIFVGRVPHEEVERYYSVIDIAPLPRRPVPVCEMVSPLKPFEAMAMGKVVVASDVAALAEIVTPGLNGLLHAKGDAYDLAARLEQLLDEPGMIRQIGRQSREWVVEHRDWARLSDRVAQLYDELVMRRES